MAEEVAHDTYAFTASAQSIANRLSPLLLSLGFRHCISAVCSPSHGLGRTRDTVSFDFISSA